MSSADKLIVPYDLYAFLEELLKKSSKITLEVPLLADIQSDKLEVSFSIPYNSKTHSDSIEIPKNLQAELKKIRKLPVHTHPTPHGFVKESKINGIYIISVAYNDVKFSHKNNTPLGVLYLKGNSLFLEIFYPEKKILKRYLITTAKS